MSPLSFLKFALSKTNPRVGIITLNTPSSLNALTFPMGLEFHALTTALTQILTVPPHELDANVSETIPLSKMALSLPEGTRDINALVLHGAGRAFSAGGSMDFLKSRTGTPAHINSATMYTFYKSFLSIRNIPVPIVAAINGTAVGAGACLTLACDYRVINEKARIGFNFSKLGIHPGMGGSHMLPRIISKGSANRLLLGGSLITGSHAHKLGLADELVSSDSKEIDDNCPSLHAALQIADEFAESSPIACRGLLRTLRMGMDEDGPGLEFALRREADQQAIDYARVDWREGLDAVIQKRKPNFDKFFAP